MTDIRRQRRSIEERPPQSDLVAFQSPKARAMLVMAVVVSLGLWAAIWLLLTSLVSAWSSFRWAKILTAAIIVVATSVTDGKSDGIDKSGRQMPPQGAPRTDVALTIGSDFDEPAVPRLVAIGFYRAPIDAQVQDTRRTECRRALARPRGCDIGADGEEECYAKSARIRP